MITLLASAALFIAAPSAPDEITVVSQTVAKEVDVDGQLVRYKAGTDKKGRRHVWGERVSDGAEFHFRLDRQGRGRGEVGHRKVKFRVR